MAFGVKVRGIPRDNGAAIWQVEAPWWNQRELMDDSRFRLIQSPGYQDFVAVLDKEEAQVLHNRYLQHYETAVRDWPDHWWITEFQLLQKGLAQGPESTRWVLVEVFEWESGL